MMKLMHNKWGITLFLLLLSPAIFAKKATAEKTRTFDKTYTVTNNQMIELDNKFGEMKITSWDKNEVSVKIKIRVEGSNEKKTLQTFDAIKIDVQQTEKYLSIKTLIGENQNKIKVNTGNNGELSIDYEIMVPINNRLKVKNSFGPLFIDKMKADVKIDLNFGSATIGELFGIANDLTFQFSDPIIINKIERGKINLQHSKLELMNAAHLVLASEMSSSMIDKVKHGEINLKFGSADINDVKDLRLNSQMSAVQVKKLHSRGYLNVKYGSVTVSDISNAIDKLEVDSEFSPIKIYLEKSGSYEIDANVNMGGLKLPSKNISSDGKPGNMNKTFKGKIGQGNNTPTPVKVRGSFGDIKIAFTD